MFAHSGKLLFISGQAGIDPSGQVVKGGFLEQAREVFRNLQRILKEAGGSFDDVVRLTVYLTDMNDLAKYTEILAEYTGGKNFPSQTAVEVRALALKDLLIEVDAIASITS